MNSGVFRGGANHPTIQIGFDPIGDGQEVEPFYNMVATPWFYLTPDLPVMIPAREQFESWLALGRCAKIDFQLGN